MPYSQDRLFEALQVIRNDNQRLHALEADKLARTQYRDGFHLRRHTSTLSRPVHLWRQDEASDEEYDPVKKRKRPKKTKDEEYDEDNTEKKNSKPRAKRRLMVSLSETDHGDIFETHHSKRPRLQDEALPSTPSSVFITIQLKSERAQLFMLQKLKNHQGTHINNYHAATTDSEAQKSSTWKISSGALHDVNQSEARYDQDHEVANLLEEPFEQLVLSTPRTLRSGKVRAELIPKKRCLTDTEDNEDENDDQNQNFHGQRASDKANDPIHQDSRNSDHSIQQSAKRVKVEYDALSRYCTSDILLPCTPTRNPIQLSDEYVHLGSSIDDAISINSDSTSERSRTLTPDTSPLLSNSFNRSSSATTAISPITTFAFPTPKPYIKTITTSFSHPINFHSTHATACTFHTDYHHPILGHGPTTTTYTIHPARPSQLIETPTTTKNNGGHRSQNLPPDTMCIPCSLSYLQITRCTLHTFTRLPRVQRSPSAQQQFNQAYVADLFTTFKRGDPRRNKTPLMHTCKLCPAPAIFRCCTPQTHDRCLEPCRLPTETEAQARDRVECSLDRRPNTLITKSDTLIQPPLLGCGLLLCSACRTLVGDRCHGRMQGRGELILREVRAVALGARADAEFLFKEGLVWKAYNVDARH